MQTGKLLQVPLDRRGQVRQGPALVPREPQQVVRALGSECVPSPSRKFQLAHVDLVPDPVQCRELTRVELDQTAEPLDVRMPIDADHAQPPRARVAGSEPVQQLDQPKLVAQVVPEPQCHLVELFGFPQFRVAREKGPSDSIDRPATAPLGHEGCAHFAQLFERESARNRAIVKSIPPRQHVAVEAARQQTLGDDATTRQV